MGFVIVAPNIDKRLHYACACVRERLCIYAVVGGRRRERERKVYIFIDRDEGVHGEGRWVGR